VQEFPPVFYNQALEPGILEKQEYNKDKEEKGSIQKEIPDIQKQALLGRMKYEGKRRIPEIVRFHMFENYLLISSKNWAVCKITSSSKGWPMI